MLKSDSTFSSYHTLEKQKNYDKQNHLLCLKDDEDHER